MYRQYVEQLALGQEFQEFREMKEFQARLKEFQARLKEFHELCWSDAWGP